MSFHRKYVRILSEALHDGKPYSEQQSFVVKYDFCRQNYFQHKKESLMI